LAGEQIAERRIAFVTDRTIEARHRARCRSHLTHVLERELRVPGDLLVGGRPLELRGQLALRAGDLLLALDDVDGNTNRPRLVGDAALDGLANPPRRVRGELVAAAPVELLHRTDQSDDSLLNQVEQ